MLNKVQARDAVNGLLSVCSQESGRLEKLAAYTRGWDAAEAARRMWVSESARQEEQHQELARLAQTPFIGLVLDTYGQSLKVDGFFSGDDGPASAWQWWQRNRMDARQTGLHRAALQYGSAYATVLPAENGGARIGVHSPRRFVAHYGEGISLPGFEPVGDEYPIIALEIGRTHLRLIDDEAVYFFGIEQRPGDPLWWTQKAYLHPHNLPYIEARPHDLGVTPVVRYQDRMMADGEQQFGIVEHLIGLQDRINRTNYEQGVAQYFAAFKQRYVIGWMPENELVALKQSVATTQFFKEPDVKVGQYDETDLTRYIDSRQATVRDFAAVAQVPAQALGANAISNISADGLAALETSKDRKVAEIQTSLGESHEQLLRLAAYVTGDDAGAGDFSSEVKWAETSARSFAQTVDGLGKLAQMLGIPPEELWSDIPGWTRERVERAQRARRSVQAPGFFSEGPGGLGASGTDTGVMTSP